MATTDVEDSSGTEAAKEKEESEDGAVLDDGGTGEEEGWIVEGDRASFCDLGVSGGRGEVYGWRARLCHLGDVV
jgi:hypothetical protein